MKNKGFGHLKTRLSTIKTSKNVGVGGPMLVNAYFGSQEVGFLRVVIRQSPRKLQHTPGAHPRQSPGNANYERNPFKKPGGRGLGVCSKGVLKQP